MERGLMGRHAAPGPPDAEPAVPEPTPEPTSAHSPAPNLLASVVLGLSAALALGAVLWWAGQSWTVVGVAAGSALVLVVVASWVARASADRQPVQ